MKNFIKQTSILSIAITIAFVVYMGVQIAQGAGTWNLPSCDPNAAGGPGACNASEPINVSTANQTKNGGVLTLQGGLITNLNAIFNSSVGIGTASPSTGGEEDLKLDVEGAVGAESYCDKDGNNCVAGGSLGGGGGSVLEKGTALYKTTSCTSQSWCGNGVSVSLGTANLVTTELSTGYSSSCYNSDGQSMPISCTSSNTFIGYSVVYFSSVTTKSFYVGHDNNGDDTPSWWTSLNGSAGSCYATDGNIGNFLTTDGSWNITGGNWGELIKDNSNPNGKPGSTDIVTDINAQNLGIGNQACQGSLSGSAIDSSSSNWKITYTLKEE